MFLIFLGIVALMVGFAINTPSLTVARFSRPVKVVGGILLVLGMLSSGIKQIDAGEVGVQSLFGNVGQTTLSSGLNFINPLSNVTTFDIKTTAAAAVVSSKVTLESGKYYTLIATDTLPSPKTLLITDDRSTIKSDKKTYVRFVNVVAGGSATGYDFILRRQGVSTTLSTLKGGEAGAVVELDPYPLTNTVNDSLLIRVPGATTNFVALNLSTTGLSANRLRTFVLRGKAASPGVNTILNN